MGRRIIVKEADFSTNAVIVKSPTWYLGYTDAQLEGDFAVTAASNFYFKAADIASHNLTDKVVEYVKIYAKSAGTLTISLVNTSGNGSVLNSESHAVNAGVNIIRLNSSITLTSSRSIGLIGNGITPMWTNGEYGMHFGRVGYATDYGAKTIPVDFGCVEI